MIASKPYILKSIKPYFTHQLKTHDRQKMGPAQSLEVHPNKKNYQSIKLKPHLTQ